MNEYQLRLVQRIQAGDAVAEHELFRQYKDAIFWKVCRRLQTDRENIKDIAGEIYLAMLEGLRKKSFLPEKWESLEAYVWGITNNKIRDWLKEEKRDGKLFHPEPPSEEIAAASEEYLLENAELAGLKLGQVLRSSEFSVSIISPAIGANFAGEVDFSWEVKKDEQVFNGPIVLKILNNREITVHAATVENGRYACKEKFTPGVYYWTLEEQGEMLYLGKFFVNKSQQ